MSFTVSSWKVEFFGSKRKGDSSAEVTARIDRVFNYLRDEIDTDIYAIYEANGSQVFTHATTMFPDYTWKITEGSGSQDILVGSRRPIFITDRTEFGKGFNGPLRPGALVTLNDDGETYSMLFLHLKAADKAIDLTFSDADVELVDEVKRLRTMYGSRFDHMPVRDKTREHTFWNGPGTSDPPSDIDHVAAAERIQFAPVNGAEVEVKGWPEEPSPEAMGNWIGDFSDHALLRFEVTGVQ